MVQEDPQADRERGSGARSAEGSERSRNHRVAVDDERADVGLREARERFGGLAFPVGGWAAGRIARYDRARNGLMTGVWTLLLGAIVSALAAWLGQKYDVLRNVDLPQWFSTDSLTVGGIVSAIVAIAAMLVGGLLGGILGERYHRRGGAAIVATRSGGIITPGKARL